MLFAALGVAGILLLIAFVLREKTARYPLLQLSLFRSRTLTGSLIAMVLFMGSIGTSYYVFTVWIGQAVGFATLFDAAGAGVPACHQGVASALMSTIQQVGTALGLALLVGLASYATATSSLNEVEATAAGLQTATWIGAGVLAVGAALSAIVIPSRR